jgi:hypothetical protein
MNFDCSSEIEFIASHFHEIDISRLYKIEQSIIEKILSSDKLVIKSEDWLYERIWEFIEEDRRNFKLIQFIRFEYVSKSIASRFISNGSDFVDLINSSVWLSLGNRFVEGFSNDRSNCRFFHKEKTFSPNGQSLEGMIGYLTLKCGGNVHDNGLIEVTASSIRGSSPSCHPKNAVDLQNRLSCFKSQGEPSSWICYDFKDMEITPSHYSILSYPSGPNQNHHPKSWCLEVSVDGTSWTEVHRCENNSDLNGSSWIGTYSINRSVKCRFVRLRQTGTNHLNRDYFLLSGFEIFGVLREV